MKLVMKPLWQLLIKEKKYQELKESIRMMISQRSDTKKVNLIEQGKKIGIDKVKKKSKSFENQ